MRCERSISNVVSKLKLQMNTYLYVGLNVLFVFLVYVYGSVCLFKRPVLVGFSGAQNVRLRAD